jgi:hypothetical protein
MIVRQVSQLSTLITVHASLAAAVWLGCATQAIAQQMTSMDSGTAAAYGAALSGEFVKQEGLQVQLDMDTVQTSGLLEGSTGIILVPAKGLDEDELEAAARPEAGAPLAYLFMTPRFNPLVDDKPADDDKLRFIEYGNGSRATALILTAKQVDGGDWRMFVFGKEPTPLLQIPIFPADEPKKGQVTMRVEDVQDEVGTLVVTVFGKYEAPIPISFKKD